MHASGHEFRGPRVGRRAFLKGACLGAVGALLPLGGILRPARAGEAAAPPPPPAPGPPTMEEVVAEWKPDALFRRPGGKVLHFYPPDRREKMPKELKPVEKVGEGERVNRGQVREIFRQLLGRYPGEVRLARASALLDLLDPGAGARVLALLGKEKRYGEMLPFLDELDRAIADRAKRDPPFAKKLTRLKAEVARHRGKVLERAKLKAESTTEGR